MVLFQNSFSICSYEQDVLSSDGLVGVGGVAGEIRGKIKLWSARGGIAFNGDTWSQAMASPFPI